MDEIRQLLPSLGGPAILNLLTQAAETHPDVRANISSAITKKREAEARRVINFDYYSKDIWKEINVNYSSMSGSKQYNKAGDVLGYIRTCVERIVGQCGPFSSPGTRYNGLSVLRKIGKTICLSSTDVLGHEVQKDFQWDGCLDEGMKAIVQEMAPGERAAIVEDESHPEALWPKLLELQGFAEEYCILEGLGGVLEMLEGEDYDEEEGYDEEEEEEEEESSGEEEADEEEVADIQASFLSLQSLLDEYADHVSFLYITSRRHRFLSKDHKHFASRRPAQRATNLILESIFHNPRLQPEY